MSGLVGSCVCLNNSAFCRSIAIMASADITALLLVVSECSTLSGLDLSSSLLWSPCSVALEKDLEHCGCSPAFVSRESTLKFSLLVGVVGGDAVEVELVIADRQRDGS